MARRRIGQEDLIARPEPRTASSLIGIAARLDCTGIDRHLARLSALDRDEPGWPPLALFRALQLDPAKDTPNAHSTACRRSG